MGTIAPMVPLACNGSWFLFMAIVFETVFETGRLVLNVDAGTSGLTNAEAGHLKSVPHTIHGEVRCCIVGISLIADTVIFTAAEKCCCHETQIVLCLFFDSFSIPRKGRAPLVLSKRHWFFMYRRVRIMCLSLPSACWHRCDAG